MLDNSLQINQGVSDPISKATHILCKTPASILYKMSSLFSSADLSLSLLLFSKPILFLPQLMSVVNTPQAHHQPKNTGYDCYQVGTPVARQSLIADALTTRFHDAVVIVDHAVEEIEDIPADDRAQGHASPVLA